jgi:AraC family transcriptional regulator, transcriptional activator of pobA
MERTQTLEDFYKHKLNWVPGNLKNAMGHFNVFRLDDFVHSVKAMPYNRKDYFKITLLIGNNRLHYADKVVEVEKQALLFSNPMIPYKWEPLKEEQTGYFCIFTEAFFQHYGHLKDYPLFQPGHVPVYFLEDEQLPGVKAIYKRMLEEINSDYTYKYDVLRNLVFELIHTALKMQPAVTSLYSNSNASVRIAALFLELLERQYPIESPAQQIGFRTPADFAAQLAVHVNHLNRALRETTGKTTSQIISERLIQEAKALLIHTNWNVSEIGWCLGFEERSHFINFFRKQVEVSPGAFRSSQLV